LCDVGHSMLLDNREVRVWELTLRPQEMLDFHFHGHPHLVFALSGASCERETIFGEMERLSFPAGSVNFVDQIQPVQRLINKAKTSFVAKVVELKHVTWPPPVDSSSYDWYDTKDCLRHIPRSLGAAATLEEILIQTEDLDWVGKSLAGLYHKMLWRNEESGASVALIKFDKGAGIPEAHLHSSNQMMFCLSGKYRYIPTGTTLRPGCFYCNPKGNVHGPTIADETSVFLEIYDGPHYPQRPSWYDNEEDAH